MKDKSLFYTPAQFARLHEINRRTLHYYDSIGLFSPQEKDANHYRYYHSLQSMEFEFIRMLKELNMSIAEIKDYLSHPNPDAFLSITEKKTEEITQEINRLKHIQKILHTKKEQLLLCAGKEDLCVEIVSCPARTLKTLPFSFRDEDFPGLFSYIRQQWGLAQCRAGAGSYLSLDKIRRQDFREYDGLFTISLNPEPHEGGFLLPEGRYLCGYLKGSWDRLPQIYQKMLSFAEAHQLCLTGYAYEQGLNEFAVSKEQDYVTRVFIQIADS